VLLSIGDGAGRKRASRQFLWGHLKRASKPLLVRFESCGSAHCTESAQHVEKLTLADLLKRTIEADHYPVLPRIRALKAILAKIEPPPAVTAAPLPSSKPGDRPRATLAALKRRRRGRNPSRGPSEGATLAELARSYEISATTISRLITNRDS
jgi:hypothetical protein